MYKEETRDSYYSDADTTQDSMHFQNESTNQVNYRDDGTLEITDTLPKREYYMSLRKNGKGQSGSMSRLGNGSYLAFGPMSGTLKSGFFGTKTQSFVDFKPSGKGMECVVGMLDGSEETVNLDRECYGQHLLDMICDNLELSEKEYFGIRFKDKKKIWFWLDNNKKIIKQIADNRLLFEFQVKFYPPTIDMVVDELTRYHISLQIRQDLINGELPCSFNVYALLAAYVMQSEAGDYDSHSHKGIQYLRNQPLAPKNIQTEELLHRVCELHKQHRGLSPEEADEQFLQNARKLALYGVERHDVKNSEHEDLVFGVFHGGILLYKDKIRVIRFSWARLIKVSYKKNKVIIDIRGVTAKDAKSERIFKCSDMKMAKRLYKAIVDHHFFFRMIELRQPRRPNLQPGFATRKYYKQPPLASPGASGNLSPAKSSTPKVRTSSKREQTVDGWNTPPSKNGSLPKPAKTFTNSAVGTNNKPSYRQQRNYYNVDDSSLSDKENIRPMLPHLHWRMAPADCTLAIGMDEKGLDVASLPKTGWQGCRSNKGVKTPGEYFYEARVLEDGLVRLGWSTNEASLNLGTDDKGFGYGADESGRGWGERTSGCTLHDNKSLEYGSGIYIGDYIGCRVNLNNGDMSWYKNGRPMNVAFKIPEQMRREPLYPAVSLKDSRVELNFGDSPFTYPPSDSDHWIPVCQAGETSQVPNKYIGWRLNAYDATNGIDVSADGLMAQAQSNLRWQGSRCNKGVKGRGKYYYEASPMEDGGLVRVGWSTDAGSLDLGTDKMGFGYGADPDGYGLTGHQGKKMFKNDIENYGKAFKKGDVIGCFLNLDDGNVQWSLNGEIYGPAYDIPLELRNGPSAFFPTVSLNNNTIDMNFGEKVFKRYPGKEWTPLTYTPEQFLKESKRRGPERKVKGLSYLNVQYENDSDGRLTPQQSDSSYTSSNPLRSSDAMSPEVPDEKESDHSAVVNKTGSRTVTNGEVTEVATNEPSIETETYYDEHGNLVKRTITKTKKITKTTKTMSELVTERSENDIATTKVNKIDKKSNRIVHEDLDDDDLRRAILSVTFLNNDVSVLNDYVGGLEFVSRADRGSSKILETDI